MDKLLPYNREFNVFQLHIFMFHVILMFTIIIAAEQSAKALLKCVIPQEVVSGKVIDRLMPWLLSSDNYHNNKVTSLVLQWIGGKLSLIHILY